jgi:hypothetical protein
MYCVVTSSAYDNYIIIIHITLAGYILQDAARKSYTFKTQTKLFTFKFKTLISFGLRLNSDLNC